jgi:transcriptional regulator with XRE-family HTH domain
MNMPARAVNGTAVKIIRELLGITQHDLAARCDVSQGHLSNVERGIFQASPQLGRQIADKLGVPAEAITYPLTKTDVVPA